MAAGLFTITLHQMKDDWASVFAEIEPIAIGTRSQIKDRTAFDKTAVQLSDTESSPPAIVVNSERFRWDNHVREGQATEPGFARAADIDATNTNFETFQCRCHRNHTSGQERSTALSHVLMGSNDHNQCEAVD